MKICVIGVGYVGLVTGAGFAEVGNSVVCVDNDHAKIKKLKSSIIPFFEPGLEQLVKNNQASGRLQFTTNLREAILDSQICFIAVGTPSNDDGSTNLRYVFDVATEIGKALKDEKEVCRLIGVKSTVPVGTCDQVAALIKRETDCPFFIFSNPEFLKEGDAVNDFMNPDRIIIGIDNKKTKEVLRELYEPFTKLESCNIFMETKSAELTKYAANAMLATRISFMNELAIFAEKMDCNIEDVRTGLSTDPRIGPAFLFSGIGYGGSCLPKDVKSLISSAKNNGMKWKILEAVEDVNKYQKTYLIKKMTEYYANQGGIKGKHIAIWGLSFKPNTDDLREAPALILIDALLELNVSVVVYDPVAIEGAKKILRDKVEYSLDPYQALQGVDALILATEWDEFKSPDINRMRTAMKQMVIFDGRNLYSKSSLLHKTCDYYSGIGLGKS